jgi:hypothetical protein
LSNQSYYNHGSDKVETCINQWNSKRNKWLSIMKPTNMSKSCVTGSSRLHPVTIGSHWSSRRSRDHSCIQCAAIRITCKNFVPFCLLYTILFRQVQMDQHKAETRIRILILSFLSTPFNQLPNILVMLDGGGIL